MGEEQRGGRKEAVKPSGKDRKGRERELERGEGHTYISTISSPSHLGGSDYVPGVYAIFFPAGTRDGSTDCVQIPLIDDTIFEKTEYFGCHFIPVDPDCDFHIYGHPYVSVHIYDDERKCGNYHFSFVSNVHCLS